MYVCCGVLRIGAGLHLSKVSALALALRAGLSRSRLPGPMVVDSSSSSSSSSSGSLGARMAEKSRREECPQRLKNCRTDAFSLQRKK